MPAIRYLLALAFVGALSARCNCARSRRAGLRKRRCADLQQVLRRLSCRGCAGRRVGARELRRAGQRRQERRGHLGRQPRSEPADPHAHRRSQASDAARRRRERAAQACGDRAFEAVGRRRREGTDRQGARSDDPRHAVDQANGRGPASDHGGRLLSERRLDRRGALPQGRTHLGGNADAFVKRSASAAPSTISPSLPTAAGWSSPAASRGSSAKQRSTHRRIGSLLHTLRGHRDTIYCARRLAQRQNCWPRAATTRRSSSGTWRAAAS